ncbi:MAG: biotin operon repressor, partial [Nitrososphaera sp.]
MDRLEEFVALLQESPGYISGQLLAKKAGISRSAVWKHVRSLRQCGYDIESLHGQGYRLAGSTEYPVPWELAKLLNTSFVGRGEMVYRQSIESTQNIAISLAEKGEVNTVVIAEQQSGGRGRMKRKWLSPRGG